MIDTTERIAELEAKLATLDAKVSASVAARASAQENYDAAKDAYAVAERKFMLAKDELYQKSETVHNFNWNRRDVRAELDVIIECQKIANEGGIVAEVVATHALNRPQPYFVVVISVGKTSIKTVKISEYRSLPKSRWAHNYFSVKNGGIWYAYGYKLKDHEAVIAEWKEKNP